MKHSTLLVLVFFLLGCATPLTFPSAPRNEPQKKFHHTETLRTEPKVVTVVAPKSGEEFRVQVGEAVEQTYSTGMQEVKAKLSLWQKLIRLGIGWIILMVLGIFFPPVAMIMGLFNRGVSKGTRRIVQGVEKALDRLPEAERELVKKTLSEEYDDNAKNLVARLKRQ